MGVSKPQSDSRASVRTNWPQTKGAKKVGIFLFQRCFPHPCFLERRSVAETHTPSSLPGFYTVGRSDLVLSQTTGLGYNENNKRQVILAWLGIQVTWATAVSASLPQHLPDCNGRTFHKGCTVLSWLWFGVWRLGQRLFFASWAAECR